MNSTKSNEQLSQEQECFQKIREDFERKYPFLKILDKSEPMTPLRRGDFEYKIVPS